VCVRASSESEYCTKKYSTLAKKNASVLGTEDRPDGNIEHHHSRW
jgi:hypothetical protein